MRMQVQPAAMIAKLKVRTLFVDPSKMLLGQTIEALSNTLQMKIGQLGDGVYDIQDVTVATVQTLSLLKRTNPTKAAKEAILKLLGTGWRGKIAWTDIEITNNAMGQPVVEFSGEVKRLARECQIDLVALRITHTANFAIASAVALATVT